MTSKYRLVYLNVDKYKNIDNKKLNFTLDYSVTEEVTKNRLSIIESKFCSLKKQNCNPLAHLDSFTALIGENGSGKSNFIELISYIFTTGQFPKGVADTNNMSYCIIEEENKGQKWFYFLTPSVEYYSELFKNSEQLAFCSKITSYSEFGKTILYHPLSDLAAGTSSHVIFNSVKIASNPFKKLSTGISDSRLAKQFADNTRSLESVEAFKHIAKNEYSRLVLLFSDFKYAIENDVGFSEQFSVFSKRTSYVLLYNDFIEELNKKQHSKEHFVLVYAFLMSLSAVLNNKKYTDVPYLVALMLSFSLFSDKLDFIAKYKDDFDKYMKNKEWGALRDDIQVHLDQFRSKLNDFKLECNDLNGSHLAISLKDVGENQALDYICSNDWFDLTNQKRSFQGVGIPLKVDGLSSGEISAIHYLNELKKELKEHGSSCLVILDEPENSFHPEWQRCLISILDEMYRELNVFPQTVISSHSPFILSDILAGKVLLLGKNGSLDNCFAANVHELLANGFFLKQTIGNAAQKEISKVVKYINNPKENCLPGSTLDERIQSANMVVDQISDSLLQKELRKRLDKLVVEETIYGKNWASLLAESGSNTQLQNELRELSIKYSVTRESNV